MERNQSARTEARDSAVRRYFYGPKNNLFPHTFEVKCNSIKIYKIGGEYMVSMQFIIFGKLWQKYCVIDHLGTLLLL